MTYDLFDHANTYEATPAPTNVATPVTTGVPTLVDYATRISKDIWPKDHTRNSNMRGIKWFSEFSFTDEKGVFHNCGTLTLTDISRKHVYAFGKHLVETRGISQSTVNRYKAGISRVIREANEEEIIDNPLKLKYAPEKGGRPRWFTRTEEQQIIDYFRDVGHEFMVQMFILGIKTGMRKGEILAITHPLADVTTDNNGTWLYLPAEVIKQDEDRYINLNTEAYAAYQELLSPIAGTNLRLIDKYSHRTFYWFWGKARRDIARGDKNFTFHVTRHTVGTRLANDAKENQRVIADVLGHKDEKTTTKYVHAKPSAVRAAVSSL